jgi:tRNA(Ile2) C34 agmatinyltransferase TiaS
MMRAGGFRMVFRNSQPTERRSPNRLETPSCPRCGDGTRMLGAIRTTGFEYFRCTGCDELLVKSIPIVRLPRGLIARLLT